MIEDCTEHLMLLTVSVHIPQAQSLKQKRAVLKSLKERVRYKFNVSVAEVGGLDKWQRAVLAFAIVGNDKRHMDSCLQSLKSFIESFPTLELCESLLEHY